MAYREYRLVRGLIHLSLVDEKLFVTPGAECPGLGYREIIESEMLAG